MGHQRVEVCHIHVVVVLFQQEYTDRIGDVLVDAGFDGRYHAVLQIFHLFAFGFALFGGQCGVRHGFVDVHHLFVQAVDLGFDFLVGIIVGSTGGGVVLLRQVDFDFAVFQEEVDGCAVFSCSFVRDVAVDSGILRALEGECTTFDDSRVQFDELASFHGFQIYGVAVGCTLYSSGYGVTVVSTVTSCTYSGYSEQISKLFHCLFFLMNDYICKYTKNS